MSIIEKLIAKDHFSNSEKQLADYILENKGKVLSMSVQELSKLTYTSTSSVVRLCRKIDLEGFQEFKIRFASELQKTEENLEFLIDPNFPLSKNDSFYEASKKLYQLTKEALSDTYKKLSAKEYEKSYQLIMNSRYCGIFALGDSFLQAMGFQNRMMKINHHFLMSTIHGEQNHLAQSLGPKDCAIIISYSGSTKDTVLIADVLKQNGTPFILISSKPKSKLAQMCKILLEVTDIESQSIKFSTFASQTGIEFVLNNLYSYFFIWPDPRKWVQIEIEESGKISIKGGSTHERNPLYS